MPRYYHEGFSFSQLTASTDGKTSASGTMGVVICSIGCLTFLLGVVDRVFFSQSQDIMMQTVVFTGLGVTLLGVKKWRDPREIALDHPQPPPYGGPPPPPYPGSGGGIDVDVTIGDQGQGGNNYWESDPFTN